MNVYGWTMLGGAARPTPAFIAALHAYATIGTGEVVVQCSGIDTLAKHIWQLRADYPYLKIIPGMYVAPDLQDHWDHPTYWDKIRVALEKACAHCGTTTCLIDMETVWPRLPTKWIAWRGAARSLSKLADGLHLIVYPCNPDILTQTNFMRAIYAEMVSSVSFTTPRWGGPDIANYGEIAQCVLIRQQSICARYVAKLDVRIGIRGSNYAWEAVFAHNAVLAAKAGGAHSALIWSGGAIGAEASVLVARALKGVQT